MAHKLATIALCGIAVSAACLGAAAAIGDSQGRDFDLSFLGDRPACNFELSGTTASRSIPWDGSDDVLIAMGADTRYRRGQGEQVVVTGDSAVLPHVRIEDGKIDMNCRRFRSDDVVITLPGRIFQKFALAGSGNMTLDGIDQPSLRIKLAGSGRVQATGTTQDLEVHIAGSGRVQASGKTRELGVHIDGSGKAQLGQLAADRVEVHVAGSGDTEIAPKDDLDVHIAGSGKVRLLSEPQRLTTHIAGSGEIVHGL